MSFSKLTEETITFGKYKDLSLSRLLKDRKYCSWLINQDWFKTQYEFLYNRVKEYNPKKEFGVIEEYDFEKNIETDYELFIQKYPYFHLLPVSELKIELSEIEKKCYSFYKKMINLLKDKIEENKEDNVYNIKAPSAWLNTFEKKYEMSREVFKEFLISHDLPNLTNIVEDIKRKGGIVYKGAQSYKIAKERSLVQEKFWEELLKEIYKEEIGVQFKFAKCIFDFIHIKSNTLYECKLHMKDFSETQYNKYLVTLNDYNLVYLISNDCIIDIKPKKIYTTSKSKYTIRKDSCPSEKNKKVCFEDLIKHFEVVELENIQDYFKLIT